MSKIIIPTPLRKFTNFQASVETNGQTVLDAVKDLTSQHPELKNHLLDTSGKLRSFIRIFVGDNDILSLEKEQTRIEDNSVISIVPAIAGG